MPAATPTRRAPSAPFLNRSPRLRAARALKEWIEGGILPAGERLPSAYDLSERLRIPRSTVNLALHELAREGWIQGRGRHRTVRGGPAGGARMMENALVLLSDLAPETVTGHRLAGWQEFVQTGALAAAREGGMHAMVVQADLAQPGEVRRLAAERPRGAIALRGAVDSSQGRACLEALRSASLPTVVYGDAEELPGLDSVSSDHAQGAFELTRWLLARGCRRILRYWLLKPAMTRRPSWLDGRDAGHLRALRQAGVPPIPPLEARELPFDLVTREDFDAFAKYSVGQLSPFLSGRNAADAIMCVSDGAVAPVAAACRLLGRAPQRDLAIVGYDHYWAEAPGRRWEPTPPLATVDKNNLEIGRALVELLRARLAGALPKSPQHRLVRPNLVVVPPPRPHRAT
jgi:DNA-binding LacI/PurR family transcriptional regulator